MPVRFIVAVLLWAMLPVADSSASDTDEAPQAADRPRVALVLSGGGARAGAHLGAAYATGMPVEDIAREIARVRTSELVHDVSRNDMPLRLRPDGRENLVGPELGVGREGLKLPLGLVAGVSMEAVLRRLVVRLRSERFDEFPVPFRAIATDAANGEMVVLEHGSLATAIRASMALPALIEPVELDGRLLVDGGVSRNLAVDLARALGADIIIAVHVGSPLMDKDKLTSMVRITEQLTRLVTASNTARSLAELGPRDILIAPQMEGLSVIDFDRLQEAVQAGEKAARAAMPQLRPLGIDSAGYQRLLATRRALPDTGQRVTAVHVSGTQQVAPQAVRAALSMREGEPFDAEAAERDMHRLYATGQFERVGYVVNDRGGGREVTALVSERQWDGRSLRFG